MASLEGALDKARDLLQGEIARSIGYGSALAVYFIARASGSIDDIPLETAITATAAYVTIVASVVESIRKFVYSPRTAEDLMDVIAELQDEVDDLRAGRIDDPMPRVIIGMENGNG